MAPRQGRSAQRGGVGPPAQPGSGQEKPPRDLGIEVFRRGLARHGRKEVSKLFKALGV